MMSSDSTALSANSQIESPSPYKLIIFDLDGTLTPYLSDELYPDVMTWLQEHGHEQALAICTNQGGVGLRYWMETNHFGTPEEIAKLPTPEDVRKRLVKISRQFLLRVKGDKRLEVFVCYAYRAKKSGKWSPTPEGKGVDDGWDQNRRKPAPGMLYAAMHKADVYDYETLMVGDTEDDQRAAEAAECAFQWADAFFGRRAPGTPEE